MTSQYRSDVLAAIHGTAQDLHDAGILGRQTMRRFDTACLTPVYPLMASESGPCASGKA